MGGRVQKIAFIIFALLFVAIMAVLNTSVLNMATSSNKTLTTTVSTSDSSSLDVYDNTTVYGSTVQECAKKPDGIVSSSLHVFVGTAGTDQYKEYFGKDTYNISNAGDVNYINPNAMFNSNLISNSNGVTVGILFYQESADDLVPSSSEFSSLSVDTLDGTDTEGWVIQGIVDEG